jgi:hypothetical protein
LKKKEMATNNDDRKIVNAIRLHLVLLNIANKAVQFKLAELIKQKDAINLNAVKDFLTKKYQANLKNPPIHLEGFFRTLNEKFRGNTVDFPNDLREFDITSCYPIARNFLNLSKIQMRPFDELREIRNKYYGHLNLLEIEDADYNAVLARLKQIINDFTQNEPLFNQALRDEISKVELIETLGSISQTDMHNLEETILDVILKNGQVTTHIDDFIETTYKDFQKNHLGKIEEIRELRLQLKKLSDSIKSHISEEEMNKIAETVSAHLNIKLTFENTLKQHCEDILSHTDAKAEEVIDHVDRGLKRLHRNIKDKIRTFKM